MMGSTLADLRAEGMFDEPSNADFTAVKEAVLPWDRFPEEDIVLGPEMRATGEVMGIGPDAGVAYAKALLAAGMEDRVLLSHDRGWYRVGEPNGGEIKPYTYLFTDFIPMMLDEGIPRESIDAITRTNPGRAYSVGPA